VDGKRRPKAELRLGQVQRRSNRGKREQGDRVEQEYGPERDAISSSLALVMGAIAAMALPPQIAVPAVMRNEVRCLTESSFPSPQPNSMAKLMLHAV